MSIKYRPEIDGLRAIAVLSVVIYHAEFTLFGGYVMAGGFIGVDIFFVISGFLITSIILRQVEAGNFSYKTFYERRARRILPALFAVMLACMPFAWILMLPDEFKDFAGSLLSSLFFGSNFWFWAEDSYWAGPSALKPLLHTWSLSIEEQFYVFFPILILAIWKFASKYLLGIILLIFFLSLAMANYSSINNPDASFFLLHTRAWELLAGAILANFKFKKSEGSGQVLSMLMPSLGLFLIINALIFFEDSSPHPSYGTLLPVIGTMLVIQFANKGEIVTDLLSNKLFVGVGLISYSLYLWHFPIFAFARIHFGDLDTAQKLIGVFLSFSLSIGAYYLIEQPSRSPARMKGSIFYSACSAVFLLLVASGAYIYLKDGVPGRFQSAEAQITNFSVKTERLRSLEDVETIGQVAQYDANKDLNVLVIGDSLGRDLWSSLYQAQYMADTISLRNIHTSAQCLLPLINGGDFSELSKTIPRIKQNCGETYREDFERSKLVLDADVIIWSMLYNNASAPQLAGFGDVLRRLNPDVKLVIANRGDVSFDPTPYKVLLATDAVDYTDLPLIIAGNRTNSRDEARATMEAIARAEDFYYLDVSSLLCGEALDNCTVLDEDGKLLYYDAHHWSVEGARYFGERIAKDKGFRDFMTSDGAGTGR